MRKFSFLILFFTFISASNVQAQQGFTELFDSTFINISRTDAATGILYERILPFSNLRQFSGNNPDTADIYQFLYGYSELYNAAFDLKKRLPFNGDSLENLISNNTAYVDIGILHYRFNVIDTLVARQKLYLDTDSILQENTAITASLYNETTVLLITPLKEQLYPGNVTFRFSSFFHFDNTYNPITQLRANFDDGRGWQTVKLNSTVNIYYPDGKYTLCFIATYSNGETDTCYAGITSSSIQYAKKECTPPSFQTSGYGSNRIDKFGENYPQCQGYSFTDYDGVTKSNKGVVWVYYATTEKKLRKPILIVDGFDPGNPRKHESHDGDYNATTNECGKSIWAMLQLIDKPNVHLGHKLIEELGYDLVVLDLPSGGDYIERNAMVTIKVIEWINQKLQENGSGHEIVVVGPSMGGQITRYALSYMEAHEDVHGKHNCRLWVSFDSPHQGANISLGTQAWAYYFRGVGPIGNLWEDKLKCVAASQMLIYHKDNGARQKFNKYYDLNNHTIGYPEKMHYPNNLRRIAVSNGSLHGNKSGSGGEKAFNYNAPFVPGAWLTTSSVYLYPEAGQTVKVFDVWHLLLSFIPVMRNHWTVTNNTNKCSIDAAPGCLYNTFFQVKNGHKLQRVGGVVQLNKEDHCFMPTTSVLDISGNMNYCTNISNRNLVTEGLTPFQSYCGPGSATNMEHITFNQHIADWLLDEIETYIEPGSREISLCMEKTFKVHLPAGKENSSIQWTCSRNLEIISGQGTGTITVRGISTGDGWICAKPTASNLLTHNKELKKYVVKVINSSLYPSAPAQITSTQTWDTPYLIGNTMTIENGATLTIKSTVFCAPSANIIIKPGATLVVDSGTLTSSCSDEMWQGIEIHGNPTDQLQNLSQQGSVQLLNGAVIENAHVGVLVGSSNPSEIRGGGILSAFNSKFINCATSVVFKPYTRYRNSTEYGTKSNFTNCEFVWNNAMIKQDTSILSYTHVKLSDIGNVTFKGCTFINERFLDRNTQAIYAYNSCLTVTAVTKANIIPYVILKRSFFDNFTYGIYYEGGERFTVPTFPFSRNRRLTVKNSDFIGNARGIFNSNANNSTIKYNYFKPGNITSIAPTVEDYISAYRTKSNSDELVTVPMFNSSCATGISLNASTGYVIQGNTFTQILTENPYCVGVHVQNSGDAPNKIDNNIFEFLRCGIVSNGVNKTDYHIDGLQLLCNTFSENCKYAIVIGTPTGIALTQGSQENPAGNTFSHTNRPDAGNIYSGFVNPMFYYYNQNILGENPNPQGNNYISDFITLTSSQASAKCGLSDGLSLHEYYTPSERLDLLVLQLDTSKNRYANLLYTYNNLIDGGSTDQLLTELELSWGKSAWEIRDKLLASSPYLSTDIILDVAKKELLPHAMLLEICLSNPDATRKGNFLDELRKQMPNPMPDYMFEMLIAGWDVKTFRTNLEASLANATLDLEYNTRQLISLYLSDTTKTVNYTDSIIYLLERLPNLEAVFELTDIYANMGDFVLAYQKLDHLFYNTKNLSNRELEEIKAMRNWYSFIQESFPAIQLNDTLSLNDVDLLQELISTKTKAGDRAKGVLYYYSGCTYNYHIEPEFPGVIKPKSKISRNLQDVLNEEYNKVSVYPNPAQTYATFMYELQPDAQSCILQIFDSKGIVVLSTTLTGNMGHYLWDTRNIASGSYLYAIISNEKKLNSGKIIVKK